MRTDSFSIRRRITLLAAVLLLAASVILVIFIRDYAERASDRAFDRLLAASALTIAGAVQIEDGDVTLELPYAAFGMFAGGDRVFYSVRAPDGTLVTGYDDLAAGEPLSSSLEPVFADADYRGETVRIASLGRLISTAQSTGWVTIRVAETQGAREALAREIVNNALAPLLVLTVLAAALVWYLIRRTFAPLQALETELRRRPPDDLAPVDIPVPAEVRHLVGALNEFMARLKLSMERLSELVAEAAHQVRTPLASLRAQAEVAMDESDAEALRRRIARIHDGAVQSSQLVTQLLMDATISHRLDSREAQATAISAVIEEVVQRLDPDHLERLSVSMDEDSGRTEISADRVVLREMLRNLIDNALKYSSGPVEIEVGRQRSDDTQASLTLKVLDRGPGIPDEEKPKVTERFYRAARASDEGGEGRQAGVSGSGLGLAIVKRVVDAHRGELHLADRPGGGLVVEIRLPLDHRPSQEIRTRRRLRTPQARIGSWLLGALLLLWPFSAPAEADPVLHPARSGAETDTLSIVGTTDTQLFDRFIAAFQERNPDVAVRYEETDTLRLYEEFTSGTLEPAIPDLLISSASDLQVKLANDGFAQSHVSEATQALPGWAEWRGEVFGFTFEPAVIIYNPDLISGEEAPRTHPGLAQFLEDNTERLRGRVATYDIATSGVGYMLAVQDQLISSQFWRLASALGRADAVLSGSSPDILSAVDRGEIAIAYNVLGSYAFARQAAGANIHIVVPDDYVLVLTRSMMIPRDAARADLARSFIDFALSPEGQAVAAGETALGSVRSGVRGVWTMENITELGTGAVQPIALGPSLMVALDQQRRSRFLDTWRGIVAPR
jgi:two-component system sensor histidine kinase TctE